MSEISIKIHELGKKYLITHHSSQSHDSLIAKTLDKAKNLWSRTNYSVEEFWALQNINLEIKQGDRVGIIGRNGAGKSTLLKILSRIVKPTKGRIEYVGKMASLLEVGTGFHGDLSGRENIYLNGSILGMNKYEIDKKFDEIVAFSEIEQFLDTPVKRYSSGMYVRLAFSVAAHLDNDILIVDEVLAVGDSAFQEKCIGKINASQSQGKTVLFVSHNIGQIAALCRTGVYLENGLLKFQGDVNSAIDLYLNNNKTTHYSSLSFVNEHADYFIEALNLFNVHQMSVNRFKHDESFSIAIKVVCRKKITDLVLGLSINNSQGKRVLSMLLPLNGIIEAGEIKTFTAKLPSYYLMPNDYLISVALHIPNIQVIDEHSNCVNIQIIDNGSEFYKYKGDLGYLFPKNEWLY
jgi:lipopolysaccharide transport system ATP-binding protein